ncbi:DUF309 domain-containing protein [Stenomitos frigidus]|uniref:DUF309 domain-containing protein n=1 Tax=Stenomitos frigidus ULC18 TaxID=2107698 RepID=A0A2T1DYW3_9CYAN|nr:DUF309 domain-containing protein [Stenomitos frigidus]PSB25631.1 DUF309 domain-containing protein [Stenomitos frigidus ULC18]
MSEASPDETLPDAFWQGVNQFNQREFYACHDTLEALWIEATEPDKKFYQGILQIAVALYHLGNQNWRGAVILMGEGMSRLRGYQPAYADIDIEHFLAQTLQLFIVLQQAGPEQVMTVMQRLGLPLLHDGSDENHANRGSNTAISALETDSLQILAFPTLQKVSG